MVVLARNMELTYHNGDLLRILNFNNEYLEYFTGDMIINMQFEIPSDKEIVKLDADQKKMVSEFSKETIERLDKEADELKKVYDERIRKISYMKNGYDVFDKSHPVGKPVVDRFTIVKPDKKTKIWQLEG